MKLKGYWGVLVVLLTDFLFYYAVEFLKSAEQLHIGQEMNLQYDELGTDQYVLACSLGIVALFIGATADYFGSSLEITVLGILFSFFSSCYILIQATFGIPQGELYYICTSVYVLTSMVKIVVILELLTDLTDIDLIRYYVFTMAYSRIIANGLLILPNYLNILKYFNCWFSFWITLLYLVFVNAFIPNVMTYETVYLSRKICTFVRLCRKCFKNPQNLWTKESREIYLKIASSNKTMNILDNTPEPYRKSADVRKTLGSIDTLPFSGHHRKSTKAEIVYRNQYMKCFILFPIVLSGVFFCILNCHVVSLTIFQDKYVKSCYIEGLGKVEIVWMFVLSKIVIYILTEGIFLPFLKMKFKRDLVLFAVGYFILVVACLIALANFSAISQVDYTFPHRNEVQLRIYNAMEHKIIVYVNSVNVMFEIGPAALKKVIIRPHRTKYNLSIRTEGNSVNVSIDNINAMTSRSMIYQNGKMILPDNDDPLLSEIRGSHYLAYCHFQVLGVINGPIELITNNYSTTYSFSPQTSDLKAFEPRLYVQLENMLALKSGVLYAAIILTWNGAARLDLFYLEGPNPISMVHLLPQVVLESVASAIATPSFFRFLYLESPSKLKCTIFTTFMSLGFFFLPLVSTDMMDFLMHGNGGILLFTVYLHILIIFATLIVDKHFPYDFPNYYRISP